MSVQEAIFTVDRVLDHLQTAASTALPLAGQPCAKVLGKLERLVAGDPRIRSLVLTQDGRIAKLLIGEDSGVEKEYLVRVTGELVAGGLALLNFGLSLDGKPLKRAQVTWQNEDQLRFILREGKKRQIRRMCELVGLKVTGLKRVRIGKVKLGDLPVGQWRYLREDERF